MEFILANIRLPEDKRWSFQQEIRKIIEASLNSSFPDLKEKQRPLICDSPEEELGDFICQNVLEIWPKFRKSPELKEMYPHIQGPRDIGEAIKKNLLKSVSDIIKGPSVLDVGFVTFSLSQEWMAQSIHKMLKDGIDTWAPKLPVERVYVDYPSLHEEIHVGLIQRQAIGCTLIRMLKYSKVSATMYFTEFLHRYPKDKHEWAQSILTRWFSIEERKGDVVINVEGKLPFILSKRDFNNSFIDLEGLRYVNEEKKPDWIIYVTPVRQQEYIEMCLTAAKLEKWIQTDKEGKWNPSCKNEYPVSTSAGYRSSSTKQEELFNLLDKVDTRCDVVAEGMAAKLLGYSAQEVIDCVLTYTLLKNHRLADCTFNFDEMVNEEGNTFVYLLNTLAEIYTIIANSRKDIDELKKASEIDEGLGGGEERVLEFHLLEFTEALEKSCLCVLPHILCEYLYELSKKFTNYYLSVYKVGSVAKISTVLLCEATALVMEKCFYLLGLTPDFTNHVYSSLLGLQSSAEQPMDVNAPVVVEAKFILDKELVDRCITPCFASVARDPPRNSRFELFSIRPSITTYSKFEKCNLFGLISLSDQYGVFSDGGPQLLEPDFANVPLFNHDWCNPINMRNEGVVYLGNPSSCHSVPFSSSIEIRMELYVTTEKKDGCFQLCNREFKLDLSTFWEEKSSSKCSCLDVNGEDGITQMHCILLKDAVDTVLEVRFKTKTSGRKVRGNVFAYYGSNFLYECHPSVEACYMALLFQSDIPSVLEDDKIPLKKSILAVPKNGSLIIKACFEDVESGEVILEGSYEFSSQIQGSSIGDINGREGTDCSLDMKIDWKYGAQYL